MKWEKVKLGNVTDSCLGKMLDQNKNKGDYQPYLANVNVRWGEFDLEDLPLMKFEESEQERYELKYGDLVICEGGEPGRCAIWKEQIPNMKIQKHFIELEYMTALIIGICFIGSFWQAKQANWISILQAQRLSICRGKN